MLSWLFSDPLPVGTEAPFFEAKDERGNAVALPQFTGNKNVVLIFYPADDTPGCTKQACQIRDHWQDINRHDVVVFGVNSNNAASHKKFREKYRLPYPLLVDQGKKISNAYQTGGLITRRTVYLIGKDGKIRFAQRGMPTPEEILSHAQ